MILAIDAGNSRVKWGWHDGGGWTSLATVSLIEFAAANHDINPFAATHENPERIVISNVAGEGAHQLCKKEYVIPRCAKWSAMIVPNSRGDHDPCPPTPLRRVSSK